MIKWGGKTTTKKQKQEPMHREKSEIIKKMQWTKQEIEFTTKQI